MKTVAKVFLWINIVLTSLYALFFGFIALLGGVAGGPGLLLAIIFGAITVVMIPMIVYNVYLLNCLSKATQKSEIGTWQKVFAFIFCGMIVAVLLCCMEDEDFASGHTPTATPNTTCPLEQLRKYKFMLDEGLISQEDYEAKKQQLLK